MQIACVTASYVADPLGYPGEVDWGLASERLIAQPLLETIDDLLNRLAPARLDGVEFWYPHIWPAHITPVLAGEIRRRLDARGMVCCACAGSTGDPDKDLYESEGFFNTARLLGAPLIAGHMPSSTVPALTKVCRRMGVRVGYENGGEKDAGEILAAIQGGNEWIGANIDTGNMAAQGGDPVRAIRELGARIIHVHMKDVPAIGSHDCVALGKGIVDVPGVIRELKRAGYDGWLSIEIETGDHDPSDEIAASAETLRRLW
ncbi:MAG: sugar phosphate isomerase/epimerase family protein [Anaerolineae bacterium]